MPKKFVKKVCAFYVSMCIYPTKYYNTYRNKKLNIC